MFHTQPEPRGFSGRPLLALLLAIGLGFAARPIASWLMLKQPTVATIILSTVVIVGYGWYWLDARHG
jgi:hypothetical protein